LEQLKMALIQWLDGLYEGRGINRSTGQMFQQAITFQPVQSVIAFEGQKPQLTLKMIKKSSEFSETLKGASQLCTEYKYSE
jgi:hypothetical protein